MSSWIGGLLQRETMPVLEANMAMAYQRQRAISNNIANVDTPHYQRQVLPEARFGERLDQAIRDREERHWNEFTPSSDGKVRWQRNYAQARTWDGADQGPLRHDENNVNLEKELGDMAKNTLFMSALHRLYKSHTQQMNSALRDRVA